MDSHRISSMIESRSPLLTTDLRLSILLTTSLHTSNILPPNTQQSSASVANRNAVMSLWFGIYYYAIT